MAAQPSRSTLGSCLWGTRIRIHSPLLSGLPLKQKLKLHDHRIRASFSFPTNFQSHSSHLPFQASREKTCLEFLLPSSMSLRIAERWVCNGGGKRPRKPRIWRTRHRRGTFSKADKLLERLEPLSNVKEEIYGALDSFIAWELDFPLIAVKKALYVLQQQRNWTRMIQVSKWMLGKGQGRTLGTYLLLLQALSAEGRIDEAIELWKKVFSKNLECTPITFFVEIIRMYNRYEMYEELLDVFADMEELNVKLNAELVSIVSTTYEKVGSLDKAEKVRQKYAPPKSRWRTIDGKIVKFHNYADNIEDDTIVSRWVRSDGIGMTGAGDAYDDFRMSQNIQEEGSSDHESEYNEGFLETEGDYSHELNDIDTNNVGCFPSKQFVRDEVYM